MPIVRAGRNTSIPTWGPVDIVPVRHRTEHAGGVEVAVEPIKNAAHSSESLTHKGGVIAMHEIVMHHRYVDQRKWGNDLRQRRGITARRESLRDARPIEVLDRLPLQPIVAGDVKRDQRLDARIADVLQLLPVRRIHISLERADARPIPVHAPHLGNPRQIAREPAALHERIRCEDSVQVVHAEWLVSRLDVQLDVAE